MAIRNSVVICCTCLLMYSMYMIMVLIAYNRPHTPSD